LTSKGVQVEVVEVLAAAADLHQQVGAANDFLQRTDAQAGQDFADLLGDEGEEVDDFFRRAGEAGAEFLVLGADADRAGVGMALAHHDAAHGDQAGGADAELFRAQHRRDDDVAPGAHAAVGA
jgi:hypothetical protein